jgi:hypothetical protein
MTDVPAEALSAAEEAIEAAMTDPGFRTDRSSTGLARVAVEAAAPVLAESIARSILSHMDEHGPRPSAPRATWRRHFRIAAQVAHFAFSTGDDTGRIAAEAIARGDFIACREQEAGTVD